MELEPMLTPREKSPLPEKISLEEDRTHDAASSRTASPIHYGRAIPAPRSLIDPYEYHTDLCNSLAVLAVFVSKALTLDTARKLFNQMFSYLPAPLTSAILYHYH